MEIIARSNYFLEILFLLVTNTSDQCVNILLLNSWYSSFVISRLRELEKLDSADKTQKARKDRAVAALQYLNYLLRFHKFMPNFLPKDVPPAKMKMLPAVLYSRMVERFGQIKSAEKQRYNIL